MIKFESNPIKIRNASFDIIKEQVSLDHLSQLEQTMAIEMIQASGDLSILKNLRFSESAIEKALIALENRYELLCDGEAVICGLKQKYLMDEPICFTNKANVISQAKSNKQTRSMTAVDLWKRYLSDSIVLIGSEPTALFRLMEILESEQKENKPALIIATPAGFSGALEAKDYLWEHHEEFGVPCITLLGTRGSNNLVSTAMNTLLKLQKKLQN